MRAVAVPLLDESRSQNSDPHSGWRLVVLLCAFANFLNSADRVLLPVVLPSIASEHSFSLEDQGWIHSAFPAGYVISQVVGTFLSLSAVPRRILLSVVFLWSLCTVISPLVAHSFYLLLTTRVVLGISEGIALPTMYRIVNAICGPTHRATGLSYLNAAGSAGQTIAVLLSPHGAWSSPFLVLGGLGFLWSLLWMKMTKGVLRGEATNIGYKALSLSRLPRFLVSPALLAIYTAHFCMNWTSYMVMHWLPTYLRVSFRADPNSLSLAALPYLANSLAGLATGPLMDFQLSIGWLHLRGTRILATSLGLLLPAIFLLLFAFAGNFYWAIICLSLCMAALSFNSAGHLANHGDVSAKYSAATFAISNTIATIPGLVVGPLTAHLVTDSLGRWWPSFVLAALLNVVGALAYASHARVDRVV